MRRVRPISARTRVRQTPTAAPEGAAHVVNDRIELVALDIDGTLLRSDRRIGRRTFEAIGRAVDRGVHVVLASARPPRSLRNIRKILELKTLQINYNGALIHDPIRNSYVFHQPLSSVVAKRVIRVARRADPKVLVSIEILDKWYTDHFDESLPTETSKRFSPDFIGPLGSFLHVPVTKLMLLAPPRRLGRVRAAVESKLAGQIAMTISDPHLIQIIHPSVDKGAALARVAEYYGVEQRHVMAVGDAPNDAGMLRWAGLGAAMANGWRVTREAADVIVKSNDKDGVAQAIKRYVLA